MKTHAPRLLALMTLLTLGLLTTGCGPLLSTVLIQQAATELEGAKAARAEQYAPYEFTGATLYLDKAREQQGYAEFAPAVDFAYKARELARKGKEKALAKRNEAPPNVLIEKNAPRPNNAPNVIITPTN